ncbi:20S proteasome subunit beta 1, partial [Pseudogymnoascus sp. 24MN13]
MEFGNSGMLNEDGIHVDMDRLKKGEVNLGTSIMAINFKDGVILGTHKHWQQGRSGSKGKADVRTQARSLNHDRGLHRQPRDGQADAGARHDLAVADIVHYQLGMYGIQNGAPPTTQVAAAMFQELCYNNKDRLSAGLIIAGWDERHGGQVYSIPLGGALHKQSYAIGGSGSTYIYGEGFEEAAAVDFVKGALAEAIKWDGSSGGVIRMVVLTKKGASRERVEPSDRGGVARRVAEDGQVTRGGKAGRGKWSGMA